MERWGSRDMDKAEAERTGSERIKFHLEIMNINVAGFFGSASLHSE
jgi:hypothetical protein